MYKDIRNFERVDFTATIPFRITDHNYGDHVANNVFVEYLHEGRVQLLNSLDYSERNLEGVGLILSELNIKYTKQGFYPDVLKMEMSITNLRPTRFDIFYRGYDSVGDLLILARTEMAAFDVEAMRPTRLPEAFASRFKG